MVIDVASLRGFWLYSRDYKLSTHIQSLQRAAAPIAQLTVHRLS